MKVRYLLIPLMLGVNTASAEFSEAAFGLHPFSPGGRPYIIEIIGEWPTDCHPGEQKPVISSYTGDTALIEFETIVVHPVCNDIATPYRVLIDMSDVTGITRVDSPLSIDVTLRFDGTEYTETLTLLCICSPAGRAPLKPEAGLWNSAGLEKQGLLLARQNKRMAVYPLIYDESGGSEWLFGAGGIEEEVYFAELHELTGGQCLGCPPPADPPQLDAVGKLTMLMDSEGLIQVKINDGLFQEYTPLEFGYGSYRIWDPSQQIEVSIPNLSGRWAFLQASNLSDPSSLPPTVFIPLVFDIKPRNRINPPPPTIGTPPPPPPEGPSSVFYGLANMENELLAEMLCEHSGELICRLYVRDVNDVIEEYDVQVLSIERMHWKNTADPDQGSSPGYGVVVRID